MSDSAPDWQAVAAADDVWTDVVHPARVGDVALVLVRTREDDGAPGAVCAYRDACPHERFPLSTWGEIENGVLVCQRHFWEFDLDSGRHITRVSRPDCDLVKVPTRVEAGQVLVDAAAAAALPPIEPPPQP